MRSSLPVSPLFQSSGNPTRAWDIYRVITIPKTRLKNKQFADCTTYQYAGWSTVPAAELAKPEPRSSEKSHCVLVPSRCSTDQVQYQYSGDTVPVPCLAELKPKSTLLRCAMQFRHDDRGLDIDDHVCLLLCLFAYVCEGRSLQAGTPELAYATHARLCRIGRQKPSIAGKARDHGKGVASS
uniref:Uncharacterized protein n=1 Tax=Ananas comosus var. bracteatus TaxID=296719 RepID=A0A6V7Q5I2_ANACO|nr:unnamed protein product [Ananas comosus var. bracteatus]